MSEINQLSQANPLKTSDQIPVYSSDNGDTRRASIASLFSLLGFPSGGSILKLSSVYAMQSPVAALTPNIGTAYQNIANQDSTPARMIALPVGTTSLTPNPLAGEFVAARDIQALLVNVNIAMTYANPRLLTLAILTGPDSNPFETPLHWNGVGQGAQQMYANFTGLVFNPNNASGKVLTGDKIRLVAKMDVAAVLTIQQLSWQLQTLDGV